MSFFNKFFNKEKKEDLDKGMEKTKDGFFSKISKVVAGKSTVDENDLDDIEDALISSDVGLETTIKIITNLEARVAKDKYINAADLHTILKDEISTLIQDVYDSCNNNKSTYFIGTLVSFHRGNQIYEVIDGQQRLTTIYLVLHALEISIKNKLINIVVS